MIRRPPRSTLFPTRRSSDLRRVGDRAAADLAFHNGSCRFLASLCIVKSITPDTAQGQIGSQFLVPAPIKSDRKSTRLNSSHSQISYAVFCLPNIISLYTVIL